MSEYCWAVYSEVDPRSGVRKLIPAMGEPPEISALLLRAEAAEAENKFLHQRRGELVIERDNAVALLKEWTAADGPNQKLLLDASNASMRAAIAERERDEARAQRDAAEARAERADVLFQRAAAAGITIGLQRDALAEARARAALEKARGE